MSTDSRIRFDLIAEGLVFWSCFVLISILLPVMLYLWIGNHDLGIGVLNGAFLFMMVIYGSLLGWHDRTNGLTLLPFKLFGEFVCRAFLPIVQNYNPKQVARLPYDMRIIGQWGAGIGLGFATIFVAPGIILVSNILLW